MNHPARRELDEAILGAFKRAIEFLPDELAVMPLSRWTESVLRYYFCRFLAAAVRDVKLFVECDTIDLVVALPPYRAFVEFKLYGHPRRFNPYTGEQCGYKGGPSSQNLREFQKCVDDLVARTAAPNLSKFVALVYADPAEVSRGKRRYSDNYDAHHLIQDGVLLPVWSSEPIAADNAIIAARLFQVGDARQEGGNHD